MKSMNPLIVIGVFVAITGIVLAIIGVMVVAEAKSAPPMWSIVCDEHGKYSFITFGNVPDESTFDSRSAAIEAALQAKAWNDRYESDAGKAERAAKAAVKEARAKQFKVCP